MSIKEIPAHRLVIIKGEKEKGRQHVLLVEIVEFYSKRFSTGLHTVPLYGSSRKPTKQEYKKYKQAIELVRKDTTHKPWVMFRSKVGMSTNKNPFLIIAH